MLDNDTSNNNNNNNSGNPQNLPLGDLKFSLCGQDGVRKYVPALVGGPSRDARSKELMFPEC